MNWNLNPFAQTVILALSLASAVTAKADIVFLSLHGASHEIAQARLAAKKAGKKLIVIPEQEMPGEVRAQILKNEEKAAEIWQKRMATLEFWSKKLPDD